MSCNSFLAIGKASSEGARSSEDADRQAEIQDNSQSTAGGRSNKDAERFAKDEVGGGPLSRAGERHSTTRSRPLKSKTAPWGNKKEARKAVQDLLDKTETRNFSKGKDWWKGILDEGSIGGTVGGIKRMC